jgi:hypothetical protein
MLVNRENIAWLREKILEAPKIIFHRYSHLDDAATQWFLKDVAKVSSPFEFQLNNQLTIDASKGEIGLDVIHPEAVKGYQKEDGSFSSAFRCVVEAFFPEAESAERLAMHPILEWVDGDDSTGSATKYILGANNALIESVGLTTLFQAYKTRFKIHGDAVINQRFGEEILSTLYEHLLERERACSRVRENCEFTLDGVVGICSGTVPQEALGYPQDYLCELSKKNGAAEPLVFVYRDPGVGLGILRLVDEIRLDHPELKDWIIRHGGEDWFFHPGGFLTACGTSTTPKDPTEIPISVGELSKKLNGVFGG